jgi:hypothetical protein
LKLEEKKFESRLNQCEAERQTCDLKKTLFEQESKSCKKKLKKEDEKRRDLKVRLKQEREKVKRPNTRKIGAIIQRRSRKLFLRGENQ